MPQLIVSVAGSDTRTVDLFKPAITLGRRSDNDIVLPHRSVSGHHCVFERRGADPWVVQDLGSRNGTQVNNQRIHRHQLRDGDVVTVAGIALGFVAQAGSGERLVGAPALQDDADPQAGGLRACVQLLNGASAGAEVALDKSVTSFGESGLAVIAVSNRRTGYFVACLDSTVRPLLNRNPIGVGAVALKDADVIELAGKLLQFRIRGARR